MSVSDPRDFYFAFFKKALYYERLFLEPAESGVTS